jgi:hypothetical protein
MNDFRGLIKGLNRQSGDAAKNIKQVYFRPIRARVNCHVQCQRAINGIRVQSRLWTPFPRRSVVLRAGGRKNWRYKKHASVFG